ncbi:chromate efflux transporter [Granulosicoccus antarcticus]|uniref:Putative chromate transport protein n=1 Tax=Granulosicoccus antarcticus IMCC3135 TaxID=1192854 RepID=A0A2Z2NHM2_9GAMM|nr:chromate efflux transporter [Granulosicoccus antarcticus]ASJ70533.1 putative chromate transport protein [Granulosicoccus antarcticus IMCC3135]
MELFRTFLKIGLLSFGGPAAQIALMHRVIVEEKGWLDEKQFLNALSFCMLLPGPEAMQLSTYAGWRLQGVRGGLLAGLLFVLPGALVVLLLAIVYVYIGDTPVINSIFLGIKAAVLVIVLHALERVAKRALDGLFHYLIAAAAFVSIFFLQLPFPVIILVAAAVGAIQARNNGEAAVIKLHQGALRRSLLDAALWLTVWWLPVIALWLLGGSEMLTELALFFSKLAIVTFGGAYAVLAYMAQDVVVQHGWLSTIEMVDGLGLAETTPGPLILVTEFVGFMAAFRDGGLALGVAGAVVVLWVTFVPCFLWIFVGAPYIDWLGAQPRLRGAMSGITAAVVGVILNLSIWFALHVMFGQVNEVNRDPFTFWVPEWSTLDWRVPVLAVLCGWLLLKLDWSVLRVLGVAALAGLLASML